MDQAQEVENNLRTVLLKNVHEKYQELIKSVGQLPIALEHMLDGVKKLDFGMLWIKEAILYSPLKLNEQLQEKKAAE